MYLSLTSSSLIKIRDSLIAKASAVKIEENGEQRKDASIFSSGITKAKHTLLSFLSHRCIYGYSHEIVQGYS